MRKRALALLMTAMMLSLVACGGNSGGGASTTTDGGAASETLTGTGEGFGGTVSVELTVADGTITDAVITGDGETPEIGGAALEELTSQVIAANGPEIDGVSGATVTSNAVRQAVGSAMGVEVTLAPVDGQSEGGEGEETEAVDPGEREPAATVDIDGEIQIGQVNYAAHGVNCFTQTTAVVYGDVVIAAYIDEYQFGDEGAVTPVPNADNADGFASGFAEGKVLFSKRTNADYYSNLMTDHAGSLVPIDTNYDIIQDYAVGKTISELKGYSGDENAADAVSGATLADTGNYLASIAAAAEVAQSTDGVQYTGTSDDLTLKFGQAAAHGVNCFSTAAVLTDGTDIILSWIDEYQFGSPDDVTAVPNGDNAEGFGSNFAEDVVLFSKRDNADYYSDLMTDHAGATVRIDDNYDAIQAHVDGMSIADAKSLSEDENAADAVSGATLADTANYVGMIVSIANSK